MNNNAPDSGCPLQLVKLDMEQKKVEVDQESLEILSRALKKCRTKQVAIVSVMGAFRTGKSFLLDLFLRYLRHGEGDHQEEAPARGSGVDFPIPAWMTASGDIIDGATDDSCAGFRFKGGMDACTEGIWVWSQPYERTIGGQKVAVLLMDTQGAWDSGMTKEQSATIFGLTAVLSCKQIYNIDMQIQEDKVENLAYFMRFAQAAIRKASSEMQNSGHELDKDEVERPFQSLDFLVRNWRHFRDDWDTDRCRAQMAEHFSKHLDPKKVVEASTAEAMHQMFRRIDCFCLPHPGLLIEKETWSGSVRDVSPDFLRFADIYVRSVFSEGLRPKTILGSELSTVTFPLVLTDFVHAFHDAAPVAMNFNQAMTKATVLLAKEQAMKSFTNKMDEAFERNSRGLEPEKFVQLNKTVMEEIKSEFQKVTIFGADDTRSEAWDGITENLSVLQKRYSEDNDRRLEKALIAFANLGILGALFFAFDRVSDFTCDWWSQTCVEMSKLLLIGYLGIWAFVAFHVYRLYSERGRLATAAASAELWKEICRLIGVYGELMKALNLSECQSIIRKLLSGKFNLEEEVKQIEAELNKKKD